MKKRTYTQRKRVSQQHQTRERIVEAAMTLHEQLGPAATTISAIAERAGVQRLTVYKHFPSDRELFSACSAKWLGLHPPPEFAKVADEDPLQRTRAALLALYSYYRRTEKMWTSVYQDAGKVPALAEPLGEFEDYLTGCCKEVARSWAPRRSKRLLATLRHVVGFSTWRSLAAQRLGDAAMAELVSAWVEAAAGPRGTSTF